MIVGLLVSILIDCLPGFYPVPIAYSTTALMLSREGHVELSRGVLAYVGCQIFRCLVILILIRMLCTPYDEDAMHFI